MKQSYQPLPLNLGHNKFFCQILLLILGLLVVMTGYTKTHLKIIFAIDVIRHGSRTPLIIIPSDPHHWSEGLGQLTPQGMNEAFRLGKKMRHYYIDSLHFLPKHYHINSMIVRATNFNRTLMTAECLLSGLYPLGTGPKYIPNKTGLPQRMQVIPIHTVKRSHEQLLLKEGKTQRKKTKSLINQYVKQSSTWKNKEKEIAPSLKKWGKLTGLKLKHLMDIIPFGDNLYIRRRNHIPYPKGINQQTANQIIALHNWAIYQTYKSKAVSNYIISDFFKTIDNHFKYRIKHPKDSLRYLLYSGHDTDILTIMSILGNPLKHNPPYVSNIRFELLSDHHHYFIKSFYNDTLIHMTGCNIMCPLKHFIKLTQPRAA